MKRPHRRIHLVYWITTAPVITLAALYFWTLRPGEPVSELPASIQETLKAE